MYIVHPDVDRYLAALASETGPKDPVLAAMEALARERSFPIVGPQVGRLLFLLARSVGARRVLELGSGFGYSAWWFAHAVGPQGEVFLTEGSSDRARESEDFLGRAGLGGRVRVELGNALEIATRLPGSFDVVFNDVDKHDYPAAFEAVRERIRPGGLFVSDNMLWRGSVVAGEGRDASTRGVLELTRSLYASDTFFTVLLPLRDGVSVSIRGLAGGTP